MFQFDQDYLRVLKPITTDGINLVFNADGTKKVKVVHMPLSAEPYLKKVNEKKTDNLKLVIEKVQAKPFEAPANPNAEIESLKKLLAQKEAENEKLLKERNGIQTEVKEPAEIKEVVIEEAQTKPKKQKDEKEK